MNKKRSFILIGITSIAACSSSPTKEDLLLWQESKSNFIAISLSDRSKLNPYEAKRISLGRKLYLDPILSVNNKISCNTCHQLDNFGVDSEATSPGHEGKRGDRNSPTTFNASLHSTQFWDGRAKDVEEQALGPILTPVEMGMASDVEVIKRLQANQDYVELFKSAFADGNGNTLSYQNLGIAIGAFERTLITPSRFDDYLSGDLFALTQKERKGLREFQSIGCTACHSGVAIGGDSFQILGAVEPYPTKDLGRYLVTNDPNDKYAFKVPSLRNVEKTAPYFHDGSVATLDQAVHLMGKHQLGMDLTDEQVDSIVAFLSSLTAKETHF